MGKMPIPPTLFAFTLLLFLQRYCFFMFSAKNTLSLWAKWRQPGLYSKNIIKYASTKCKNCNWLTNKKGTSNERLRKTIT